MFKSLVVLAAVSAMSGPAFAQAAPDQTQAQAQPAKPQMVKKRVCEQIEDEDSYSRLGTRKICRTIEVPATADGQPAEQAPAANTQGK